MSATELIRRSHIGDTVRPSTFSLSPVLPQKIHTNICRYHDTTIILPFNHRFSRCPPPLPVSEENLWNGFFFMPDVSVKALKGTQSANPNQWPGFILSSSTTGLQMK